MGAVGVVVLEVVLQHYPEVAWSGDQEVVEAFAAQGSDPAFGDRVRSGVRTGVRMMRMSAPATTASMVTASKVAVNVVSRSRIKKRNRSAWSPRSVSGLRPCWVTQAPVGWAVIREVSAAGAVFDHNEDVDAAQADGVDVASRRRGSRVPAWPGTVAGSGRTVAGRDRNLRP